MGKHDLERYLTVKQQSGWDQWSMVHGDFTILLPLQSHCFSSIPGKMVGEVVNPNLAMNHTKE